MAVTAAIVSAAILTRPVEASLDGGCLPDDEDLGSKANSSLSLLQRRGNQMLGSVSDEGIEGMLEDMKFILVKRYNLSRPPSDDWDVIVIPDQNLTHSCANYTDDGSTVFQRDGNLVLRVSSECEGGTCLNSGRIMSKDAFKYGIFSFTVKVPKCNHVWPAIWLLPNNTHGEGAYGRWPCSGEIDVLETVHDESHGSFNLVSGFGSTADPELACRRPQHLSCSCSPGYCTSSTMSCGPEGCTSEDKYFVEGVNCSTSGQGGTSWREHTFVLYWQPDTLITWVDPTLRRDDAGRVMSIVPQPRPVAASKGKPSVPTWKGYRRSSTPKWQAVEDFMSRCYPDVAKPHAPFDQAFKLVLNIAVGGYGGAPCTWGNSNCSSVCGGAVGSEMVISDISIWERLL